MSFSKEQKAEILLTIEKTLCCRRAVLFGMLSARAEAENDIITIKLDGDDVVAYFSALVQAFYNKSPEAMTVSSGGRGKVINFTSKSAAKSVRLSDERIYFEPNCSSCLSAFLRGVFLASGRLSDPAKQHHFELGVIPARAEAFDNYFSTLGLNMSIANRANSKSIYSKRSETIEDFFALAGMNNTVFKLMNAKINSEVRNNANRIANCETNNISKAVDTAGRQVALINELERLGLMGSLPDDLIFIVRYNNFCKLGYFFESVRQTRF